MREFIDKLRNFFSSKNKRRISLRSSTSGDQSSNDSISSCPQIAALKSLALNTKVRKVSQGQAYQEAMADTKVLVYHHRAEHHPIVRKGLAIITHKELEDLLLANPTLQLSKKPIIPHKLSVNIYQHDLRTASQDQAEPAGTHPNDGSNIACVEWYHRVNIAFGIVRYDIKEIHIISPKTS